MELWIKANEGITKVIVDKNADGTINGVKIQFNQSSLYSDLEMWLSDKNGKYCDYSKMNLSIHNKMKFSK